MGERTSSLLFRMAVALISATPEPALRTLGHACGYLTSFFAGDCMKMVERHMRRLLGCGTAAAREAARQVFGNYGRYWAELLWLRTDRIGTILEHMDVQGVEHLQAARDAGHGMIIALPHLGNWDIAAPVLARERISVTAVVESFPRPWLTEWIDRQRRSVGMEVLARRNIWSTALLAKRLKAGHAVALVCDRDLSGSGVPVSFFGEVTTLPRGPAVLSELTGAPILPAAVYFHPCRGHRVLILPPLKPPSIQDRQERLGEISQRLATIFEALIRSAPTQWLMLQPVWPSDRKPTGP